MVLILILKPVGHNYPWKWRRLIDDPCIKMNRLFVSKNILLFMHFLFGLTCHVGKYFAYNLYAFFLLVNYPLFETSSKGHCILNYLKWNSRRYLIDHRIIAWKIPINILLGRMLTWDQISKSASNVLQFANWLVVFKRLSKTTKTRNVNNLKRKIN